MAFKQKLSALITVVAATVLGAAPVKAEVICDGKDNLAASCHVPAYEWHDSNLAPKAMVVLVHGFTQQARSAETFARELAGQGYLVLSMDLRGHGRWMNGKEQEGHSVDYRSSMNDLLSVCRAAHEAHSDLALYCVGESTGAALVAQAASRDSSMTDGIILCSAGTRPAQFNLVWVLSDFFSNCFRLNHPVDLRKYIRRYASNDPRVSEEMLNDPLDRNEMSSIELLHTVAFIARTPRAVKHLDNRLPLLVVQGAEDHILVPATVPPLVRRIPCAHKQLVVFPQCGHILVGTSYAHPEVKSAIQRWLDNQVKSAELSVTGTLATVRADQSERASGGG